MTKKVIQALMDNDNPHENAGTEMLIAYSSPFAKVRSLSRIPSPPSLPPIPPSRGPWMCCLRRCAAYFLLAGEQKMDPWRFESPANMASKLAGDPDACCVLRCQDFRYAG